MLYVTVETKSLLNKNEKNEKEIDGIRELLSSEFSNQSNSGERCAKGDLIDI
jgi:hypothetical protein